MTQARGKFLFRQNEKVFLKAIRVGEGAFDADLLRESGANTAWLQDPTPERIDLLLTRGFFVVPDLGFREVLHSRLTGDAAAEERWRLRARRCLGHCAKLENVVGLDLGAGHSSGPWKLLGKRRWLRLVREALRVLRAEAGDALLTCTIPVSGGGATLGSGLAADVADTFHGVFGLPLDFASFEFLDEDLTGLRNALARVQLLCNDLPLVAHVRAADSGSPGLAAQARALDAQVRLGFNAGCAGVVIGDFQDGAEERGLIDARGRAKPSLAAAATAFSETPFSPLSLWPAISVVVCAHHSADTLEECLAGCAALNYPDFEVIVVVDKSRDLSEAIAARWAQRPGFRLITLDTNRGLSAARNIGARSAAGEIVAYLDADAFPDPDWLRYLAMKFLQTKHAIVGGPNLNPLGANAISDCVDKAPGNPGLVMLDADACDHVAGCNLAVRREFLDALGGFTESYRAGGDDVTLCWRAIRYGGSLGFAPGALVWHYRRWTVRQFLKQQRTYGRGEHALERDWPERFNSLGHQVAPDALFGWKKTRPSAPGGIYQPFASTAGFLLTLGRLPEFQLASLALFCLGVLAVRWAPFLVFLGLGGIGLALWIVPGLRAAARAPLKKPTLRLRAVTFFLFLAQPLARAWGRWGDGMTPWRDRLPTRDASIPRFLRQLVSPPVLSAAGAEDGAPTAGCGEEELVVSYLRKARRERVPVSRGGARDDWHLQLEGGIFAGARACLSSEPATVWRIRPYVASLAAFSLAGLLLFAVFSVWAGARPAALLALPAAGWLLLRIGRQGAAAMDEAERLFGSPALPRESLLWKRFQPPRYLFEDLTPPLDPTRADDPVAGESEALLQGGHVEEQPQAVAPEAVRPHG